MRNITAQTETPGAAVAAAATNGASNEALMGATPVRQATCPTEMRPCGFQFYEEEHMRAARHERQFALILPLVLGMFIAAGLYMKTIEPRIEHFTQKAHQIRTRLVFSEPVKPQAPRPKTKKLQQKPLDLSDQPKMAQTNDEKSSPAEKKVRRVYGLRKVYSKGLGTGGSLADAVIGKLGNTIYKDIDTITATTRDIKGQVVSATTVTTAPSFRRRVKPEYTKDMIENRIEGVVKVKVLVDIDGRVKKATALNDLGFDAATQAMKATLAMEFNPAMRGDEPVAVWIIVPIRFVMLG